MFICSSFTLYVCRISKSQVLPLNLHTLGYVLADEGLLVSIANNENTSNNCLLQSYKIGVCTLSNHIDFGIAWATPLSILPMDKIGEVSFDSTPPLGEPPPPPSSIKAIVVTTLSHTFVSPTKIFTPSSFY